jgi:hypothetical protein
VSQGKFFLIFEGKIIGNYSIVNFRIVFTNRKKYRTKTEVVSHKFIVSEDIFEFGPLLVGSNRDRCVFLTSDNLKTIKLKKNY